MESDLNRKNLITVNKDGGKISDHFRYTITDYSETGFMFFENGFIVSFDKNSGEILKTASIKDKLAPDFIGIDDFKKKFVSQQIIILDEEHFVVGDTIFGMDSPAERFTYGGLLYPEQSVSTFDGNILSWVDGFPFGYELDEKWSNNSFPVNKLISTDLWLNGTIIDHFSKHENVLLLFKIRATFWSFQLYL